MSKVVIEDRENVAVVRLNNGKTNALGPAMVDDLSKVIDKITKTYDGMVLAGGDKFFSIGLDLPQLLALDRAGMAAFWSRFELLVYKLLTLQLPSICAIRGHAIAGGTILALTCDYRFGASDQKKIGLNEMTIGVPVPYLTDMILRQTVGDRTATKMIYQGELMTLSDAIHIGLVDVLCAKEEVEVRAIEKAVEMISLNEAAFVLNKSNRIEAIRLQYESNREEQNEKFLDCWFGETAQELLRQASKKF